MPKDMEGVMGEFKGGKLHSGSSRGPRVTNRKQAVAIGLSEQRKMGKKVAPDPNDESRHHIEHAKDHLEKALNGY